MRPLEAMIHDEIRREGMITFARFMEMALYHPQGGYYFRAAEESRVGREGDFMTSVSVGALFGRLLARKMAHVWEGMGQPTPFHLVEAGGFDGRLARDILEGLEADAPACRAAVEYYLVEPLPLLEVRQRETLRSFPVRWVGAFDELPPVRGMIFGNELLDAFPVHLLVRESSGAPLEECAVGLTGDDLVWMRRPAPSGAERGLPADFRGMTEHGPLAADWLRAAARRLHSGRILLLDYGWTDEEYFQVVRPKGTVRGYRQHRPVENLLAQPGEQDLTAHVRWTPLLEAAAVEGLRVEEFIQQGRWLTRILAQRPWELSPTEIRQFHTLTHPQMLGAPFRALVLAK